MLNVCDSRDLLGDDLTTNHEGQCDLNHIIKLYT